MMNKTTFKNEMVKNGFECLQFKGEMIYNYMHILVNFREMGNNKYNICIFDNHTLQMWEIMNINLNKETINKIFNIIDNYILFE